MKNFVWYCAKYNDQYSDINVKFENVILQCEIWRAEHRCRWKV